MSVTSYLYAVEPNKTVTIEKSHFFQAWVAQQKSLEPDVEKYIELTYNDFVALKTMLDDFIVNRDVHKEYGNDFCFEPFELDDGFWHSIIDIHTYANSALEDRLARTEELRALFRFSY